MPELPEVETVRVSLNKYIPHGVIKRVVVKKPKLLKDLTVTQFQSALVGQSFQPIERIGKLLIWPLKGQDLYLLTHLKMTGQFIFVNQEKLIATGHSDADSTMSLTVPNKYTHIEIHFNNGGAVYYNDMRQFGYFKLVNKEELLRVKSKYGLEPLTQNFSLDNFIALLQSNPKANLKQFLLNQSKIAGLGNIYVDEIAHRSGVSPMRKVGTISKKEILNLYEQINKVIKQAIKERGTTFSDYLDADGNKGNFIKYLKVYQRMGQHCLTCKKGEIVKVKIGGRGTHYCNNCQK